jgi:CubicO group peptidase (beta-lactamase class C family)
MVETRPLVVSCVGDGELSGDLTAGPAPWWSVAKTCIAAAALILAERGKLKLDEPLAGRAFTLRQLLRHDAGLRDYSELPEYFAAVERGEAPWSEADLLARVQIDTPAYELGVGWTYSNAGYLLVRRAIELAYGADLDIALRALVFEPVGVAGVRIAREPADLAGGVFGNPLNYHPGWVYHGLLIGPPRDAALWMHRLMTGRLLAPPSLAAMLERRSLDVPLTPGRPWSTAGYGLGVMMDIASPLGRCFGHSGEGPGSVCAVYHFPDLEPPRTVAAFAAHQDEAVVEHLAIETAALDDAKG